MEKEYQNNYNDIINVLNNHLNKTNEITFNNIKIKAKIIQVCLKCKQCFICGKLLFNNQDDIDNFNIIYDEHFEDDHTIHIINDIKN
jgi:hypothetical protein